MDSFDRDELMDQLDDILHSLYEIEDEWRDEIPDCSRDFKDATQGIESIIDTLKDMKCEDEDETEDESEDF